MKTILLSAYACLPNHGSEEGNGWNYATLLSEAGLRVHCITQEKARDLIEPILASGLFPNLTVHYVTLPNWLNKAYGNLIGMYCHYLYWQWKAARMGRELDATHQFDLVHHATYSSIQLGSFMYRVGKPFVFGPVGGGQQAPVAFKRYFGPYWSREKIRDVVSNVLSFINPGFFHTVNVADLVLISNEDTMDMARILRKDKPILRMLDAGLTASFMPPVVIRRPAGPTMKLLWVGRLLPRKGIELTIEAFSKVSKTLPITLTIVGGQGEMAEYMPGYLTTYDVADRVDWVGHVSYDRVKEYYRESDVFFFTSLRDSCPMQLMEAMAYSLPVVTLALHGQNELVDEQTGIKVPVETPAQATTDLARAIEHLFHHPAERAQMAEAAYAFAQQQLWPNKINRFTQDIYPGLEKKVINNVQ
ncbi:glycosyltransferase family 4 protein [Fibrella aquatilis]|uniref:Glycosyltransferase family 4 protein n=1 Tax=Fibrella aquatilis TaxID=2817059 RepID=A0A939JWM9_9BACT|nr:glycosyltransferase family 4 protein [Fibrella aquatilis]MBO0932077.1 glycosyltransferase family 4 protein [Fibrella aquatilis]